MKKVIAIFALIFLLAAMGGCTQTKAFRMTDEEFHAKLNENLAALGSELVLPAFEKQYGTISVNGGPPKEDKSNINYYCSVNDRTVLSLSPGVGLSGDMAHISVDFPADYTEEQNAELMETYILVSSAVIMTVDPKEDLENILRHLKLGTAEEGILDYDSYHMAYESNVFTEYRVFSVQWMR